MKVHEEVRVRVFRSSSQIFDRESAGPPFHCPQWREIRQRNPSAHDVGQQLPSSRYMALFRFLYCKISLFLLFIDLISFNLFYPDRNSLPGLKSYSLGGTHQTPSRCSTIECWISTCCWCRCSCALRDDVLCGKEGWIGRTLWGDQVLAPVFSGWCAEQRQSSWSPWCVTQLRVIFSIVHFMILCYKRVTWPEIFSRLLYNHMSSLHGETLGAGAPWCYESIYVIRSRKFLRQVVIFWVWWCFLSNFIFWQLATPSVDLPTRSYFTLNLTMIHSTRWWWKKFNYRWDRILSHYVTLLPKIN